MAHRSTIIAAVIVAAGLALGLPAVATGAAPAKTNERLTAELAALTARVDGHDDQIARARRGVAENAAAVETLKVRVGGMANIRAAVAALTARADTMRGSIARMQAAEAPWPETCSRRGVRWDTLAPHPDGDDGRIAPAIRHGFLLECDDLPGVFVIEEYHHHGDLHGRWCETLPETTSDTHRSWWESHPDHCYVPGRLHDSYILDDSGEYPIWRHHERGLHGQPSDGG